MTTATIQELLAMCGTHEAFKFLHLGMISELPRNLYRDCQSVGPSNAQSLHHFAAYPVAGRNVLSQAVRVDKTVGWKTFNYFVY